MNLLQHSIDLAFAKNAIHFLLATLHDKCTLDEFKGYCDGMKALGCQKFVDEFIGDNFKIKVPERYVNEN